MFHTGFVDAMSNNFNNNPYFLLLIFLSINYNIYASKKKKKNLASGRL